MRQTLSNKEECRLKMSMARKGKPKSEETKNKMRLARLKDKNPMWKGDNIGFSALHIRIRNLLPKPQLCQICNKVPPYDLANISGKYLMDLSDWQYLCRKCHMLSDGRIDNLTPSIIDMSNHTCAICGSNRTWVRKTNNRPQWYHLENKIVCQTCYSKDYWNRRVKPKKDAD